ncbi:MAG: FtsH protease activity modulator HflK [Chloroflexota bacterium]|nr:MAG: FtsH protease activity modulator HflK [Chloroflexota bacterium]
MGRKENTLVIAMGANVLLIGMKLLLARLSGSMALTADAWHSVADLFVTGAVLVGLFLARLERQKQGQPGRAEHAAALFVAIFIFYMAYRVFTETVGGHGHELSNVFVVALASLITIAISYFMGRFKLYVGQQTSSPALLADGYHSMMHMWSSVVVVAGLFGYLIGFRTLDRVAAVIVALFIAYTGYHILSDATKGLTTSAESQDGPPGAHRHGLLGNAWKPSPSILRPFVVVVVALYLLSGLYYVQPGEVGIVRRFGQWDRQQALPGLHYRLPWPFESTANVAVAQVRRFATPPMEILTGDENLVTASLAVQYDISSASDYLFNVSDPDKLLAPAASSSLRQTVGEKEIDYLLTTGRKETEDHASKRLQSILDDQKAGIRVQGVQLVSIVPPREVADAFVDVASAREDKNTFVNEALSYRNEVVPRARGEAERMVRESEAYRAEKINTALGDAQRFRDKVVEYAKAKEVTTTRLYLEAVEKVLPKVKKFIVSPEIKQDNLDLWFVGEGTTAPQVPQSRPSASPPPSPSPAPSTGSR